MKNLIARYISPIDFTCIVTFTEIQISFLKKF